MTERIDFLQSVIDNADVIAAIAASVTAVTAIIATVFARQGLSSWMRQRQADLRDRVLLNFYMVQGIIEKARQPFSAGPQLPDNKMETNVYNHTAKTLALHERDISEWRASRHAARIHFRNIDTIYRDLDKIITRIRVASVLLTLHHQGMSEEDKREHERVIHMDIDNDEVQAEVEQLVTRLEKVVRADS